MQSSGDIRHAVENLIYEYAARADELDFAGVAQLLRNAKLSSHGGVDLDGEDEIRDHLEGLFATAERSRHMITNIRIVIADDGASASTQSVYNKWVIGETPVVDAAGRYTSSFRIRDGVWEFASHEVRSQWRRTP